MIRIHAHAFGRCWVPAWFKFTDSVGELHCAAGEVAHMVPIRIEFESGNKDANDQALALKAKLKLKGYSSIRVVARQEERNAAG